jgi:hypothetical protein
MGFAALYPSYTKPNPARPHPEAPRSGVSKDEWHRRGYMVRDGAFAPPHHEVRARTSSASRRWRRTCTARSGSAYRAPARRADWYGAAPAWCGRRRAASRRAPVLPEAQREAWAPRPSTQPRVPFSPVCDRIAPRSGPGRSPSPGREHGLRKVEAEELTWPVVVCQRGAARHQEPRAKCCRNNVFQDHQGPREINQKVKLHPSCRKRGG